MFVTIKPTAQFVTRKIGKADNRFNATFQKCDLSIPDERLPRDYEHRIQNDSDKLDPNQTYYLAGSSFGVDRFGGLELNRFQTAFVPEVDVLKFFTAVRSGIKAA